MMTTIYWIDVSKFLIFARISRTYLFIYSTYVRITVDRLLQGRISRIFYR
jgi:hypothetical protein